MGRRAVIVPLVLLLAIGVACQRRVAGPVFEIRDLTRSPSNDQHEALIVARGGGAEESTYRVLVSIKRIGGGDPNRPRGTQFQELVVHRGVGKFATPGGPAETIQLAIVGYMDYVPVEAKSAQTSP